MEIQVDPGIKSAVETLWQEGIRTLSSCQGSDDPTDHHWPERFVLGLLSKDDVPRLASAVLTLPLARLEIDARSPDWAEADRYPYSFRVVLVPLCPTDVGYGWVDVDRHA